MLGMPLIEPIPVADDYCSGLAIIEDLGLEGRFVLYVNQTIYEAGDVQARVVKRKIVMAWPDALRAANMVLAFAARRAVTVTGQHLLRLVRKESHESTDAA